MPAWPLQLNDPNVTSKGWGVVVKLPLDELASHNKGRHNPPRPGDFWRINFSRVQWRWQVGGGSAMGQRVASQGLCTGQVAAVGCVVWWCAVRGSGQRVVVLRHQGCVPELLCDAVQRVKLRLHLL